MMFSIFAESFVLVRY